MKLVNLTEKEFDKFAEKHEQASFYQTSNWGNLKKTNGWIPHYVALKENDTILGASLLLLKRTPLKKNILYAPRGFLIDYNDINLLESWTTKIKEYAKEKNAMFIKIDPYVSYQQRDDSGNIVKNGFNNKKAFENLIKLKYKHFGFNIMQDTLQPRWMFVTNTKGKTLDDILNKMDPKTRQILNRNKKLGITTREIGYDEIPLFKDIMEKTGERREFIDRPLSYYQKMFEEMKDKIKILIAELNIKDLINSTKEEIKRLEDDYAERKYKHDNKIIQMNENKFNSKQENVKKEIERLKEKLKHYLELSNNKEVLTLGGILFLISGNEVLSLVGGSYKKYMEFKSAYTIHFEGLKYAVENNFSRYNFYGIVGDFDESKPMGGLLTFKKSYSGEVVELLGEFDLIINKPTYIMYKIFFGIYHSLKKIKAKL